MDESILTPAERLVLRTLRCRAPTRSGRWWETDIINELQDDLSRNDIRGALRSLAEKGLVQQLAHDDIHPCYKHHILELVRTAKEPLTASDIASILSIRHGFDAQRVRGDAMSLMSGDDKKLEWDDGLHLIPTAS